jgi:hydroxymethylpyrimidine pyrophosphatase-like HAD family hydrolase
MRMLLTPLHISLPIAAFNGGIIATPQLDTISEHLISQVVARRALELFQAREVPTWVFSGQDWLVRSRDAPFVAHEERTVGFAPKVVADLAPFVGRAAKIVGVSQDHELLARCEKDLSAELTGKATVVRSQAYYLDITHPLANRATGSQRWQSPWQCQPTRSR